MRCETSKMSPNPRSATNRSIRLFGCLLAILLSLTTTPLLVESQEREGAVGPSPPSPSTSLAPERPETATITTPPASQPDGRLPSATKSESARVTVVGPRVLRPLSDYHVLVSLADSQVPATIDLQLTGARDSNREQTEAKSVLVSSGQTQTVKFEIGDWPSAEYTLSANAQAIDRSWNFTQESPLVFQAKSFTGLIQTDKAIYKPGQLVQFRALFLTSQLTPLPLKNEINVTVTDPKRNVVRHWTEQSNYRGLLSLELQLSEDPMLGEWTVKVSSRNQEFLKQFTVAEYILPTFDVQVQLPKYATYNQSNIVATVRADYTYGKPVNGHVTLTVQPLVRFRNIDTRPLHQSQYRMRLSEGKADFQVDLVEDLKIERELFEREIEFFALVEEDLTGRKYNRTQTMKVHDKSVKIELLEPWKPFKAGLSHLVQLKVAYQDDTPVEDSKGTVRLEYEVLGGGLRIPAHQKKSAIESVELRPVNGIVEHVIDVPRKILAAYSDDLMVAPTFITLEAVYRGQRHYLDGVQMFSTKSQQYMQIMLPQLRGKKLLRSNGVLSVNDELRVQLRATEPLNQVTCQGLARGDIVWALNADARNKSEYEFPVRIERKMAPEFKILCFYVRNEDREVIADSVRVQVGGLLQNPVKLTTSREEAKPGQEVEVGVFTKPNSLVGVLGIDQSVLLLKTGNDISQQQVNKELSSYGKPEGDLDDGTPLTPNNVETLFDQTDVVVLTNNFVYSGSGFREGRLYYMDGAISRSSSSLLLSARANIAVDEFLLSEQLSPPDFHLSKRARTEPLVIRSFFPETWMWQNGTASENGQIQFKAKVPDTITSWQLTAFSLNEQSGFGLSGEKGSASLRVFRPFFIKLNLPYSIIRGETLSVQAIVFNYSKKPVTAKVTLENRNEEFVFVKAANSVEDEIKSPDASETRTVRIGAQDGASVSFLIEPRRLGHIDIRVTAQAELVGDGLVKKLLVKPEGQVQRLNKAMLINLNGADRSLVRRNVSIDVPANAVADSQKVYVSAIGDILGAGLSNLDDLLHLPYGCGEQNMILLVPNIVVMNYLQNTRRLRDLQRNRAIRNIEVGYQRELNYKRLDGSFSAFGQQDANGSVWLTAYVLKTLQQAKQIIAVDEKVLRRAANFIARFSRPDGSIEEVGMLHNKALASSAAAGGRQSIYLTAYSMIALLQRPIAPDGESPAAVPLDEVLEKGLDYLERQVALGGGASTYELAIVANALQLAGASRQTKADATYEKLWTRANERDNLIWWSDSTSAGDDSTSAAAPAKLKTSEEEQEFSVSRKEQPPPLRPNLVPAKQSAHLFAPDSLSVEITSLALLATVRKGELERALPIVTWLVGQQNAQGGYASTQDTVLAIEALAAFAEASGAGNSSRPLSVDVELLYPRSARQRSEIRRTNVDEMLISQQNALVQQQTRLPDNITWVQVQATGSGAAVVQVSWQYNLLVSAEQPAFYLNPILDKSSNINYLQLSVCTFYKGDGDASNMAVVDVELPSGYVADGEALPGLKRHKSIKRVDTADGETRVLIYLDKVTRKDELCFTVPAHRSSRVSNNRPVPVTIYDYYDRKKAARIFYEPQLASSCEICTDSDETCSSLCSTTSKKSARLVSLHEQRRQREKLEAAARPGPGKLATQKAAPNGNSSSSDGGGSLAQVQLLPLAPVLLTLMAALRNLQQ